MPLPPMDRSLDNNDYNKVELNDTVHGPNRYLYRISYPDTKERTCYSVALDSFSKIDHSLGYKMNLHPV